MHQLYPSKSFMLVWSGQRRAGPPTEPGLSLGFLFFPPPFLSPMDFLFLAIVTFGLLSWGHFISGNCGLDCTDAV